jgi:multimeric flavodoxin WrbA
MNVKGINASGTKATNALIVGGTAVAKLAPIADKLSKFFGGDKKSANSSVPVVDTGIPPLSQFISSIKTTGIATTNSYTFTFTPPSKVIANGSDIGVYKDRLLNLMCASTELPSINISTQQVRYFGEIIDMPNDKNYGGFTSTFYVDASMYVKLFFDRWIEYIQNPNSREFAFYDDYTANIVVTVFDKHGLPHYMVCLESAYPKTIGAVQLSQDSREVMKITVDWVYRKTYTYMIENDVKAGAALSGTQVKPTLAQQLMGYAGQFKDYQNKFNNTNGDIGRSKNLIKKGDWGGLVGQNNGSVWG